MRNSAECPKKGRRARMRANCSICERGAAKELSCNVHMGQCYAVSVLLGCRMLLPCRWRGRRMCACGFRVLSECAYVLSTISHAYHATSHVRLRLPAAHSPMLNSKSRISPRCILLSMSLLSRPLRVIRDHYPRAQTLPQPGPSVPDLGSVTQCPTSAPPSQDLHNPFSIPRVDPPVEP
ncbi:hypothetical protein OBBRIDRAFT_497806 [Obba rivulosa]|uniref:Uncharacterized protein n=1 Tax=Obba rivulosa TaxID=1052685 RepID=A0A8E2DU57_9APHY|nr:hypothetical protein OBBRIDRAFT_497806 [Obba rivulosa]